MSGSTWMQETWLRVRIAGRKPSPRRTATAALQTGAGGHILKTNKIWKTEESGGD